MLTLAVLSIILTAPLGAIAISLFGPLLLKKSKENGCESVEDTGKDKPLENGKGQYVESVGFRGCTGLFVGVFFNPLYPDFQAQLTEMTRYKHYRLSIKDYTLTYTRSHKHLIFSKIVLKIRVVNVQELN